MMNHISAEKAYTKTHYYSQLIAWLRILNNILGIISLVVFAYLVWWVWNLGLFGVFPFLFSMWIFNAVILPAFFGSFQLPLAEKAKWSLLSLADHNVITHRYANELLKQPVEYWTNHLDRGISSEGFEILNKSIPQRKG